MITKEDLRIPESSYFKTPIFYRSGLTIFIPEEDAYDPGKIALNANLDHEQWSLLMAFNVIIDPLEELYPGRTLLIPDIFDIKRIKE